MSLYTPSSKAKRRTPVGSGSSSALALDGGARASGSGTSGGGGRSHNASSSHHHVNGTSSHHHHASHSGGGGAAADLSDEQRQEIKEAFDLFDTDKDGAIDFHEMKVAMRALGFDLKKPEVLKLLRDHDRRGDGMMEWEDFNRISESV